MSCCGNPPKHKFEFTGVFDKQESRNLTPRRLTVIRHFHPRAKGLAEAFGTSSVKAPDAHFRIYRKTWITSPINAMCAG